MVCYKEFVEALSGGLPVEDFAGTFVEHLLVGAELLIRDQGEVGALGEVMADAVVLAFAGGSFPWAMGVAEEDLELEVGGEALMFGHFLALIIGEALAQDAGQGASLRSKASRTLVASFCGRWQRKV